MNEFGNNNNQQNDSLFDSTQPIPTYTTPSYDTPPTAQNAKMQKKGHSTAMVVICCVLAAVIGAASAIAALQFVFAPNENSNTKNTQNSTNKTSSSSKDDTVSKKPDSTTKTENINISINETASSIAEAVALKCTDSVVGIRTVSSVSSFFGEQEQTGDGSGVIYTADGYIITNYHVIKEAVASQRSRIDVYLNNNQSDSYPATVVGYNISCDLAVLKIEADNLKPIELGNSDDLKIGQNVVTIGAPGGIEFMGSVTYGIVSGLDRIVSTDSNLKLIQTDAAINPGNSGGALLDAQGKLIGINSSKIASVEYEGMGFAIPINTAKEKCDKIISKQNGTQVYLGVNISTTYTAEVLEYYGFPVGAVVSSVVEGSPAEKAGIQRGDIITIFNDIQITEYTVLHDALFECEPDTTVRATIYRSGKYYDVPIELIADSSN